MENFSSFMTPSLSWGTSSCPEVLFFFFLIINVFIFVLPQSKEISLSFWSPGVFCYHLEVVLEELFHILMTF